MVNIANKMSSRRHSWLLPRAYLFTTLTFVVSCWLLLLPSPLRAFSPHPTITTTRRIEANNNNNKHRPFPLPSGSSSYQNINANLQLAPTLSSTTDPTQLQLLAAFTFAFASSHIGMSAVRRRVIDALGNICTNLHWVGNEDWKLPAIWADSFGDGQTAIFPTAETAGRQLYRIFYTCISFYTLGSALQYYLASKHIPTISGPTLDISLDILSLDVVTNHPYCYGTAVVALAAAFASLFNASPLGLMPGFQTTATANTNSDEMLNDQQANRIALERDDSLKFQVRGLTKITRHPLILPVVPWGIANAILLGGDQADWILLGGLALYAILGCAAQDLRVSRQEGSVGTTFGDFDQLQVFFDNTSFLPFAAVLKGKQSIQEVVVEIPWAAVAVGLFFGMAAESVLLRWLVVT